MTRIYKSWPMENVDVGGFTADRPKMGALDLPYRCYEASRLKILDATEAELTTLEVDTLWIRQ